MVDLEGLRISLDRMMATIESASSADAVGISRVREERS